MRKLLYTLIFGLCFVGTAQAQFYISVPNTTIITGSGSATIGGLGIGTYNLYEDFGIRASVQGGLNSAGSFRLVEGSVDGTYSFGEGIVFYTGAGLGYSSVADTGDVTLAGFVGLDFDANSVISLFLELRPIIYIGSAGAAQIRSGLNFHIGSAEGGSGVQGECCVIP